MKRAQLALLTRKKCLRCLAPLTRCRCRRNNRRSNFVGAMGVKMQPDHPHRKGVTR